jgi:hypothetical protein
MGVVFKHFEVTHNASITLNSHNDLIYLSFLCDQHYK